MSTIKAQCRSFLKHRTTHKAILVLLLLFALYLFNAYNEKQNADFYDTYVALPNAMAVHFIDVGQGDAALVMLPGGERILIDAGTNDSEMALLAFLDRHAVTEIDYAIFTHPHEDHIGGADQILDAYTVHHVILTEADAPNSTYHRMMDGIEANGSVIHKAAIGDTYTVGAAEITLLGPLSIADENQNNTSIVLRLSFGEISFLFTGDTEADAEAALLASRHSALLDADVLKVGHHGSSTASSDVFLAAITPQIAVISCGEYNDYGHPHNETLKRLSDAGTETICRTDTEGTVSIYTDGKSLVVYSQKGAHIPK